MSDHEINESKIREQTEKLIDLLREHHPEQEYEPEGLRIREEPAKQRAAPPPGPVKLPPEPAVAADKFQASGTLRRIIDEVAARHDLDPDRLMSRERSIRTVVARKEVYVKLRRLNWGWSRIARSVQRDHSTIRHHVEGRNLSAQS